MRQITYKEYRHPRIYQWDQAVVDDGMMQRFGIGKGWWPLVHDLMGDLFAAGWNGELLQVKEKFGGLRFYIDSRSESRDDSRNDIHRLIFRAEEDSLRICEECGAPGVQRYGGWIKTLCDRHHAARQAERTKGNAHQEFTHASSEPD